MIHLLINLIKGTKLTFAVYGVLCLFTLFGYIAINYVNKDAEVNNRNQFVNDETGNYDSTGQMGAGHGEYQNASSTMNRSIEDTKYYYQQGANQDPSTQGKSSKSNFMPLAPHGTPSSNPNWLKQFGKNNI